MYITKGETDAVNLAYYALAIAIMKHCNSAKEAYMLLGVGDSQTLNRRNEAKANEV